MRMLNKHICPVIAPYTKDRYQDASYPMSIPSRKLLKRIQYNGIPIRSRPILPWMVGTLHMRYLLVRSGSFHIQRPTVAIYIYITRDIWAGWLYPYGKVDTIYSTTPSKDNL